MTVKLVDVHNSGMEAVMVMQIVLKMKKNAKKSVFHLVELVIIGLMDD